jgi:hypothetical protein
MSYLLNYKNWRAIHESAIFESLGQSIQDKLATSLDAITKAGLGELEFSIGQSGKDIVKHANGLNTQITNNIESILNVKNEYDENQGTTSPLVSITSTVKPILFNNAMGLKVPYDASDKNGQWAGVFKDKGKLNVHNLLTALNGANLALFYDDVDSQTSTVFTDGWTPDTLFATAADTSSPNWIQATGDQLTIAPDDNLPTSFGGTLASGQSLSKMCTKDGYKQLQTAIYTFGGYTPQGGADLTISDAVSTVTVTTDEVVSTAEKELTNANEVFVVGTANYVDPKGGPAKLKTAIQSIFNNFKAVTSIKVIGGASNEGGDALNKTLVGTRATAVATLIKTSWPELNAVVSADTANYTKIQPAGDAPDATFRSIFLVITGTQIKVTSSTSTSVDLAATVFKKDQIIINEYLITAKLDSTKSNTYLEYKKGADKEKAKGEKKEATIDEQWAAIKKGYTIKFKDSRDETKIIDLKVEKVEDGKIYVLDADDNPKEITRDRFTGLGTLSLAAMQAVKGVNKLTGNTEKGGV